jgi:hypothetical protein
MLMIDYYFHFRPYGLFTFSSYLFNLILTQAEEIQKTSLMKKKAK